MLEMLLRPRDLSAAPADSGSFLRSQQSTSAQSGTRIPSRSHISGGNSDAGAQLTEVYCRTDGVKTQNIIKVV